MYQIVSSAKSREMCDFGSTELRESTPLEVVVRNRVLGQHEQKPPMKLTLRQKVIILALTFVVILITPGIIIGTTSKKDVISTESIELPRFTSENSAVPLCCTAARFHTAADPSRAIT